MTIQLKQRISKHMKILLKMFEVARPATKIAKNQNFKTKSYQLDLFFKKSRSKNESKID